MEQHIRRAIDSLPRIQFAAIPTPLQEAPRLARNIGCRTLYLKRDDLTGLAMGGNKSRELEFIMAEAVRSGADTFVAGGGAAQSNHARQCAAAARAAGLRPVLVLRRGLRGNISAGNLLLTELLCDEIYWIDDDPEIADRNSTSTEMDRVAMELQQAGHRPWVLHSSFHPLAAAAYVACGIELIDQLREAGIDQAHIVCTSMGATHVGLRLALKALQPEWPITAMGWRPLFPALPDQLCALASQTAGLLGLDMQPTPEWFTTLDHGGPAYGIPSDESLDAIRRAARSEGVLLDPVYTGKGFAGLIHSISMGEIDRETPVVFVHTGGSPALFAYPEEIQAISHQPETI